MSAARFALALLCGSCGAPTELVLDQQEFREDAQWSVERLTLRAGARLTVSGGARVVLRARELVFEGPARVSVAGAGGRTPEGWTSSGVHCAEAHLAWAAATLDEVADRGENGGHGGSLEVRYQTLRAPAGALEELLSTAVTAGGAGGAGRSKRCGCAAHTDEVKTGPEGARGLPGEVRAVRE